MALLVRAELLNRPQLEAAQQVTAGAETATDAAAALVEQNLLTDWQSQKLLSGSTTFRFHTYKFIDKLGEGKMGEVYRVERFDVGRVVALKFLRKRVARQPDAQVRFLREIEAVSALEHPHIVRTHYAEVVDGKQLLVMEYVDGRTLRDWLSAEEPLPIRWACECIRQAALGLQHIHEHGFIHRDLEPGNLMVTGAGTDTRPHLKILDLGMSRITLPVKKGDSLTAEGQILGRVDYISPEQAESSKHADIRSDIYSLGCILFELLAGRQPFPGKNVFERIAVRSKGPPSLREFRPEVTEELEQVVSRTLAPNPDQRYQTPAELAQALAPFAYPATV